MASTADATRRRHAPPARYPGWRVAVVLVAVILLVTLFLWFWWMPRVWEAAPREPRRPPTPAPVPR